MSNQQVKVNIEEQLIRDEQILEQCFDLVNEHRCIKYLIWKVSELIQSKIDKDGEDDNVYLSEVLQILCRVDQLRSVIDKIQID